MKKGKFLGITAAGIVLVTLIFIYGNSKSSAGQGSLKSQSLGVTVSLGMPKVQVDKLLGKGELEFEEYVYQPDHLMVSYKDGKVASMSVEYPNTDWVTKDTFGINTDKKEIIAKYGESLVDTGENALMYGYDQHNKQLKVNNGASYGVVYACNKNNKVIACVITQIE